MQIRMDDGAYIEITPLGIFEIDSIGPHPPSPFTYQIKLPGTEEVVEVLYDYTRYENNPPKDPPNYIETSEHNADWYQHREYILWRMAMTHKATVESAFIARMTNIRRHIVACILSKDRIHVVSFRDWDKVLEVAFVPMVTVEMITEILAVTFKASFANMDILSALKDLTSGLGDYDSIKLWEIELMNSTGMIESVYSQLPVMDRARRIAAYKLPIWMEMLETDQIRKKAKK